MPWHPRLNAIKLQRECDRLSFALLQTRERLQKQERLCVGLEIALSTRLERIDELNSKIERLREQNRRLDQEAERLAEMVRFAPQVGSLARRRRKDDPHPAAASPLI